MQRILVTGATGKVGQAFIGRLLSSSDDRFTGFTVRAVCHSRALDPGPRVEVVTGSIDRGESNAEAPAGSRSSCTPPPLSCDETYALPAESAAIDRLCAVFALGRPATKVDVLGALDGITYSLVELPSEPMLIPTA